MTTPPKEFIVNNYEPKKGDRVRVVLEGKVRGSNDSFFIIGNGGDLNCIFRRAEHVVSVERVDPPVEVFGPGTLVEDTVTGDRYTVGNKGYYSHTDDSWVSTHVEFTPDHYTRVEVPEKVEQPIEVFGPGTLVEGKVTGIRFTVGSGGFYNHRHDSWSTLPRQFTSEKYARVDASVIEPPLEVFGPGTLVEGKKTGIRFTVGSKGYYNHHIGWWRVSGDHRFTSERFTRIEVP